MNGDGLHIERLQLRAVGLDEDAGRALAQLIAEGLAATLMPFTGDARLPRLRVEVTAGPAGVDSDPAALAGRIVEAVTRGLAGDGLVSGAVAEAPGS